MDIAIMQRGRAILALTVLVLASSCYQEEEMFLQDDLHGMKKMTVEASWDDGPETRTVRQSDGRIFWSPGDKINLFYGSSPGSEFTATITEPSATAPFEGYLLAATGASEQGVATQTFWGVYPYDAANTCDGTGVYLTVKGTQVSSPGSFGNGMNPAVANSPGLSLSFKNVGSWFVFSVLSSGVTSVTFSGNNGEDIAGKVHVTLDSSGKPVSEVVEGEGLKSITVTPENGNEFIPNTDYYITLLPQTLSQGYTFTMYTGDGKVAIRKTESSKTFVLSQHSTGRKIDKDLPWQTLYVDMGDGVMWATMNVGASSPQDFGDYFAWGETTTKDNYSWSTYSYGTESNLTKYNSADGLTRLQPGDDAATVNWGGDWRTPTEEEWAWLTNDNNCTWTKSYNPYGYTVTSRINGNSIFLPLAGYYWEQPNSNYTGYYWSSDLSSTYLYEARMRMFDSGSTNSMTDSNRSVGRSVRPVRGQSAAERYVELGPGVKWAKMNIGASSPEESGDYFAWGETRPKSEYSSTNYAFGTYRALTKYVNNAEYGTVDGRTALLPVDDAATAAWGGDWRTPTQEEWNWLESNCTMESATENGVSGYRYTSNVSGYTDKSIFIPRAGFYSYNNPTAVQAGFSYWTSVMCDDGAPYSAWMVNPSNNRAERYTGRPIRAVYMPRVALTSLAIREESVTVGMELKTLLSIEYTPANATEHGVIWTSSDESIATVSGYGEVTGVYPGTATITATSLDGGFSASCTVKVMMSYVDMGNGYEWGYFNIGADSPSSPGDYFAWGELYSKDEFTTDNYTSYLYNLYSQSSGNTYLKPSNDVASRTWGTDWRIPSKADWQWLIDNCTWTSMSSSGYRIYVIESNITHKKIYLPIAGVMWGDAVSEQNDVPYYWSSDLSTLTDGRAQVLTEEWGEVCIADKDRDYGMQVRAVRRVSVDMGNGLKWAVRNLGTSNGAREYEYGGYYSWGDAWSKSDYSWATYRWMQEGEYNWKHITKYTFADNQTDGIWYDADGNFIGDGKTSLADYNYADDPARIFWGGTWRTPTDAEWTWLRTNCTWTWTDNNQDSGIAGWIVTSNVSGFEGNSIFLPAAGERGGTNLINAGSCGSYWSSSLDKNHSGYAWDVYFNSEGVRRVSGFRFYGMAVRPVSE